MKDNYTLKQLKRIFAEVLLCSEEELMLDKPYVDMGVDSILVIQISKLIKLKLKCEILSSDLYNFTSINDLARHIAGLMNANQSDEYKDKGYNSNQNSKENNEKIAVVGISGRFPGATTPKEYWQNLVNTECSIIESNRWSKISDKQYKGGFLKDIAYFDSNFFNISPREAALMDPQQRLLMEVAWEAFEDSGLTMDKLSNSNCGVFTTSLPGDYKENIHDSSKTYNSFSFLGNAVSVMSGRISYFFNLKGPSINIDTACSSSLVAIDLAVKYLQSGVCDIALVGASCIFSTSELFKLADASNLLSKSGLCYTFDHRADGFVPAEAVSCIVLRKVTDAVKDRQEIYGIIEAIEVNHDGFTNGLMSPNSNSQRNLIISTYKKHKINPSEIGYIEAHGTGTAVGDPLEVKALKESFEQFGDYSCYIGSSKANIGHTLVASGLASVIKVLLSFKNNAIPAQANFISLNQEIQLGKLMINTHPVVWPKEKDLAAISAFGFSGTNAHLVLRKPNQDKLTHLDTIKPYIFLFTAKDDKGLIKLLNSYKTFLRDIEDEELVYISYSLNCSTNHFKERFITIADTKQQLIDNIEVFLNKQNSFSQIDYRIPPYTKQEVIQYIASNQLERRELLEYLGYIAYFLTYEENIDMQPLYPSSVHKVSLLTYPFDYKYFWTGENEPLNDKEISAKDTKVLSELTQYNKQYILEKLKERLSNILGYKIEDISSNQPLQSFGIDSIVALQLLEAFKEDYGSISPKIVFDSNNLGELAEYLASSKEKKTSEVVKASVSNFTKALLQGFEYENTLQNGIEWFIFGKNNDNIIILLPPLNTLAHAWIQQLEFLLQRNCKIYIPHYPGHGRSIFQEMGLENIALNILKSFEAIEETNKKFDLLGWSLGGCISILISLVSSRVQNSILINTAVKFDSDVFAQSITLREELLYHKDYLQDLFKYTPKNVIDYISAGCSLDILKYYYNNLQEFDVTSKLSLLDIPCMIVFGVNDPVISSNDINHFKAIKNSKIIPFYNEGHFIPLTMPFKFNKLIENFTRG